MKNIWILLLTLIIASCSTTEKKQEGYVVTGTVTKPVESYVFLQKKEKGVLTNVDSIIPQEQKFSFTGEIGFPEVYYINIPATKSLIPFFLEPSDINIKVDVENIDNSTIKGSETQNDYEEYLNSLKTYDHKIREAYSLYRRADDFGEADKVDFYDSVIDASFDEKTQYIKNFVLENNDKVISPHIAFRNSYQFELDELEEMSENFSESLKPSVDLALLNEYIDILQRVDIGQPYVTFTMQDTTGIYVPVSSFIGDDYVLIDFWASWCGPCREENPYLVSVYEEFSDEDFEIVGVSLDTSKEKWIQAIENDGLIWPQISDLKGWDNSAARLYGVRSIPANVLLDKDGYIIDKNLRGDDLRKKLEQIFASNV